MYDFPLTGAQKTFLRGLGQTLQPAIKVGKAGLTPAFYVEMQHLLDSQELVKVRFLGADRHQRAELTAQIADEARCVNVGGVGATALFYRQQPDPTRREIQL
jgi:RNA-binding protein